MCLVGFIPVFAEETPEVKGPPVTQIYFYKDVSFNGVNFTVRITCNKRLVSSGTLIDYVDGSATVTSVSGGSATVIGEYSSDQAGSSSSIDLTVIVDYRTVNNGTTRNGQVTFVISGESLE